MVIKAIANNISGVMIICEKYLISYIIYTNLVIYPGIAT